MTILFTGIGIVFKPKLSIFLYPYTLRIFGDFAADLHLDSPLEFDSPRLVSKKFLMLSLTLSLSLWLLFIDASKRSQYLKCIYDPFKFS